MTADAPSVALTVAPPPQRSVAWIGWTVAVLLVAVGAGGWYVAAKKKPAEPLRFSFTPPPDDLRPDGVPVEVVRPKPGGLDRVCVQPGTVEPFESADLYAKVSGFLSEQSADIGSRVKRGEVLARLSVPEAERTVDRDAARVRHDEARVKQADARILAAEAEAKAADAGVALSKTLVRAKAAYRQYRERQLARVRELNRNQAVEARLVDEQEDQFLAAREAETAAQEAVTDSTERAASARAKVAQAKADRDEAVAGVGVAQAELERSRVLFGYATVTSPYDGVVTRRNFSRGDFVRAADSGGERVPLFAVERTDLMRVVVQVPDRDVPFVNPGDPANVEFDAAPGRVFPAQISRSAASEDPATRMMRTEIDLPNPDGLLRRGMYGKATLTLVTGATTAVRVPSAAVVGRALGGKGTVRVVRDGKAVGVPVKLGSDDGIEAEVLGGLTVADEVVLRADGPLPDGAAVSLR